MSKQLYCSYCGTPLVLAMKALVNKQVIIKTVEPHDCDEDDLYLEHITDSKVKLEKPAPQTDNSMQGFPNDNLRDQRAPDALRKGTIAPIGVLNQINANTPSNPAGKFDDLDKE